MTSSNCKNIAFTAPILLSHRVSERDFNVNFNLAFITSQPLLGLVKSTKISLMKPKNILAVVKELAASSKSKFQQWHPHGVKNAPGLILNILVQPPLLMPTILASLSYPCPRYFWIPRPFFLVSLKLQLLNALPLFLRRQ